MSRSLSASQGDVCYHVFNRGNEKARVFHDDSDYDRMTDFLVQARVRIPMRILAFCLMSNHFHLVLWPIEDGDLSRFMKRLMNLHIRAHRLRWNTVGHIWQGRFKAFPIEKDEHLLTVMRYVERNPNAAGLTSRAETWPWSSAHHREIASSPLRPSACPVELPPDWLRSVNETEPGLTRQRFAEHIYRQVPFGSETWRLATARSLKLARRIDGPGRPPSR